MTTKRTFYKDRDSRLVRSNQLDHQTEVFWENIRKWVRSPVEVRYEARQIPREEAAKMLPDGVDPAILDDPGIERPIEVIDRATDVAEWGDKPMSSADYGGPLNIGGELVDIDSLPPFGDDD